MGVVELNFVDLMSLQLTGSMAQGFFDDFGLGKLVTVADRLWTTQ